MQSTKLTIPRAPVFSAAPLFNCYSTKATKLSLSTLCGLHPTVTSIDSGPINDYDTSSAYALNILPINSNIRRADVRDPLPWIDGVDQIYHLACPASPVHFETQPIDILQTCFNGASNVLDYAVKQNARVLLASTSGKTARRKIPSIRTH